MKQKVGIQQRKIKAKCWFFVNKVDNFWQD